MRDVAQRGGGFWIASVPAEAVFTPEDLSDFQRQMAATVREFVAREVLPALPALEAHDWAEAVRLLRRAGELGLTALEIPAEFGGLDVDKVTATVVMEAISAAASFGATFGAHTGIGTLPIVFFGNREQKQRYLPRLATAEWVAAYALTEAGAGSDALGGRASARLSPDGRHWILNGTKQWITNAGFADVFVVYAKVDGDPQKFSAFIVERTFPGVSTGREEEKMGLRGSSTRSLILEDAQVPVENLLYEVGKGPHIAFNILNIGRFKLGAATLGGARLMLETAARYALERRQFGRPIAQFPLIQQKLADMAVRIYALESAVYRTAGLLDQGLRQVDTAAGDSGHQSAAAIREYAPECSIVKVLGSETLDRCVDEAVQIHGGYGFMEEYPVCRAYRDSRINRIFEGTNEINRLLIPGELLKKALRGQLPLLQAAAALQEELVALAPPFFTGDVPLEQEEWLVQAAKKAALMVAGLGVQQYGQRMEEEQEFLAGVADMLIEVFAMESALLRAKKHPSDAHHDLATAAVHDGVERLEATGRRLLCHLAAGDALRTHLAVLRKLTRREPVDRVALGRRIAQRVLAQVGP